MAGLTTDEITQRVLALVKPLAEQNGADLIELRVASHGGDVSIQVMADIPQGGISIALCSTLNRRLIEAIDAAGFIPEDCYSLEVSSPGLDRPLKTLKDFLRNLNAEIYFYMQEAVEGKKEFNGILTAADADVLTVVIGKNKQKKQINIPLAHVQRGMLVI